MLHLKLVALILALLASTDATHPCDTISGNFNNWIGSAISKEVIVVGGGLAGLSATKTLLKNKVQNVLLLEAQDYLGGRVKTYRKGTILVEDGAEWLNGGTSNPLYSLAERLGGLTQPLNDSLYDWRAKTWDGRDADQGGYDVVFALMEQCEVEPGILVPYHDTGYGQCYIDRFPRQYDSSGASPSEKEAWYHYMHMWVLKDTGANNWMDLSGRDGDHFTDWGLDDWNQWKNGMDTLTNYLLRDIQPSNFKTSSPVCKIFWDSDPEGGVLVVTSNNQAYIADYVIVTSSVGHLKERHTQLFSPPLPREYQQHLNGVILGVANKVQIGWDYPWWGNGPLNLHIIFTHFNLPEEESWLYGIMEFLSIHQQDNLIQAFLTGERARMMEQLPEEVVKQHLLKHLRRITGQNVPEASFFRRSQWEKNIWMRGSYNSLVTVAGDRAGLKSRDPLAKTTVNRAGNKIIFWAGEHTHNTRYGTVDGALETGEREAYKVIDEYDKVYG